MGAEKRGITPLGAIARGVVAGVVGTAAMDLISFGRYRRAVARATWSTGSSPEV